MKNPSAVDREVSHRSTTCQKCQRLDIEVMGLVTDVRRMARTAARTQPDRLPKVLVQLAKARAALLKKREWCVEHLAEVHGWHP